MKTIVFGNQFLNDITKCIDMKNNPFDITKAVDYTDDEIYRYWVDIKEHGFHNLIKPETLMPMIIVGSKGSGKTHIMKYFSYELQKITKPIDNGLKKDKFIGVYIIFL